MNAIAYYYKMLHIFGCCILDKAFFSCMRLMLLFVLNTFFHVVLGNGRKVFYVAYRNKNYNLQILFSLWHTAIQYFAHEELCT